MIEKVTEIDRRVVKLILNASESSHPKEFAGILRADGKTITEVLFLPGTHSSDRSAIMKLNMLPISSKACGSVHSHPSSNSNPSEADLNLFGKFGQIHIIIASPYDGDSWKAFDRRGRETDLKVVKTESWKTELDNLHKDILNEKN